MRIKLLLMLLTISVCTHFGLCQIIDQNFKVHMSIEGPAFVESFSNDDLMLIGRFERVNDSDLNNFAVILKDGETSPEFNPNFSGQPSEVRIDYLDRIYLNGTFYDLAGELLPSIIRVYKNGLLDTNFNYDGLGDYIVDFIPIGEKLAVTSNNHFSSSYNGGYLFLVDSIGNIDPSFELQMIPRPENDMNPALVFDLCIFDSSLVIIGNQLLFADTSYSLLKFDFSGKIDSLFTLNFSNSQSNDQNFQAEYCFYLEDVNKAVLIGSQELKLLGENGNVSNNVPLTSYIIKAKKINGNTLGLLFLNGLFTTMTITESGYSFTPIREVGTNSTYDFVKQSSGEIVFTGSLHNIDNPLVNLGIRRFNESYDTIDHTFSARLLISAAISDAIFTADNSIVLVGKMLFAGERRINNICKINEAGELNEEFIANPITTYDRKLNDISELQDGQLLISARGSKFPESNDTFPQGLCIIDQSGKLVSGHQINQLGYLQSFFAQNGAFLKHILIPDTDRVLVYGLSGSFGGGVGGLGSAVLHGTDFLLFSTSGDLVSNLKEDLGIRCFGLSEVISDNNSNLYVLGNNTSYQSLLTGHALKMNDAFIKNEDFMAPYVNDISYSYFSSGLVTSDNNLLISHSKTFSGSTYSFDILKLDIKGLVDENFDKGVVNGFSAVRGILELTDSLYLIYGGFDLYNNVDVNDHVLIDNEGTIKGQLFDNSLSGINGVLAGDNHLYVFGNFLIDNGTTNILKLDISDLITSVQDFERIDAPFKVYPNPSVDDIINLIIKGAGYLKSKIILRDHFGRELKNMILGSELSIINVADLDPGIYYLTLYTDTTKSYSKKIIIH